MNSFFHEVFTFTFPNKAIWINLLIIYINYCLLKFLEKNYYKINFKFFLFDYRLEVKFYYF